MIALRQYREGDELRVDARADFRRDFLAAGGRLPQGHRFTLVRGEDVVGVSGFTWLGWRQWGAWAYLAELAPREWLLAGRTARNVVIPWASALLDGGADIYATPADTDAARRLLAYIGFRPSPDDAGVWKWMGRAGWSRH